MTFRIAVVQPICHAPPGDAANIADAERAIARAAGEGAQFVCFPETYPGPWRMPATFDPSAAMVEAAAKHKTHVVFGTIAPIDAKAATAYNLICMAYPDGRAHRGGGCEGRAGAVLAGDARPGGLIGGVRGQAGRARPAMATARALRAHLSAPAARSGGVGGRSDPSFRGAGAPARELGIHT